MQTILVAKDQLDDLDHLKKDYFNAVLAIQAECVKNFNQRFKDKTMECLSRLSEMAAYAYDMDILKETSLV